MKKHILLFAVVVMILSFVVNAQAWEISLDNTMGGAVYEGSGNSGGTNAKGNWSSFYYKGNLAASKYDNKQLQGEAFYGMFVSPTSNETLKLNGVDVATDDLNFWGIDTGIDLGWALPIDIPEKAEITLTPLVGYRWKYIRFTRTNVVVLRVSTADTFDENYNIHSIDVGGRVNFKVNDKINVFVKPIFGIVVYDSADNGGSSTVTGNGGFLFNCDVGLNYAITKNFLIGGAFRIELTHLDDSKAGPLWPGLDTYSGTVTATYKF